MICPSCNAELDPQLDYCPSCERAVYIYTDDTEKIAYTANPVEKIFRHFSKLMSDKLSRETGGQNRVVFSIKPRDPLYKYSVVQAKRLLRTAEYDLDLLLEAITWLFENKNYAFKLKGNIGDLNWDIPAALAVISAKRAAEQEATERRKALDNYEDMVSKIMLGDD